MTSKTYVDYTAPAVDAAWLNDVDEFVYEGMTLNATSYPSPHFGMAHNPIAGSILLVRAEDADTPSLGSVVQIQKYVDSDQGLSNPKVLKCSLNYGSSGPVTSASNEWAISGDVTYNNEGTGNCVAVSGVTFRATQSKNGTPFAGHFQLKEQVNYAVDTDVAPAVGVEMNIVCGGADHPTDNAGAGNRTLLHLIAKCETSSTGFTNGEVGRLLRISTEGGSTAKARYGIHFTEGSATGIINTAIRMETTGAYGLRSFGVKTTADIALEGDSAYGILCQGTYTNAAIRIADDQYIGLRSNNAIKMRYDTAESEFELVNSGTERFSVSLGASPAIGLNSTQVVGTRITGWAAATNTKSKATFDTTTVTLPNLAARVGQLIDDLITHGLIGT